MNCVMISFIKNGPNFKKIDSIQRRLTPTTFQKIYSLTFGQMTGVTNAGFRLT